MKTGLYGVAALLALGVPAVLFRGGQEAVPDSVFCFMDVTSEVGLAEAGHGARASGATSPGKPRPVKVLSAVLLGATVPKPRDNNRVVPIETRVVYGPQAAVQEALDNAAVSEAVNTVFMERHNSVDRKRNAHKARELYGFSKDWQAPEGVTYFMTYSSNFC